MLNWLKSTKEEKSMKSNEQLARERMNINTLSDELLDQIVGGTKSSACHTSRTV